MVDELALYPVYQSRGPGAGRSGNGSARCAGGAVGRLVGAGGSGVAAQRCIVVGPLPRRCKRRNCRAVQRIDVMIPIQNITAAQAMTSAVARGLENTSDSTVVMNSWNAARISPMAQR